MDEDEKDGRLYFNVQKATAWMQSILAQTLNEEEAITNVKLQYNQLKVRENHIFLIINTFI